MPPHEHASAACLEPRLRRGNRGIRARDEECQEREGEPRQGHRLGDEPRAGSRASGRDDEERRILKGRAQCR